jgi:hypothetical protein
MHPVERHVPHRDAVDDGGGDVADDRAGPELRHGRPDREQVPGLGRAQPLVVRFDVRPATHRDQPPAQASHLVVGVPARDQL